MAYGRRRCARATQASIRCRRAPMAAEFLRPRLPVVQMSEKGAQARAACPSMSTSGGCVSGLGCEPRMRRCPAVSSQRVFEAPRSQNYVLRLPILSLPLSLSLFLLLP
ncbi:unnamed protein product [Prorocentrum cordatum]|uniref:Uncharacterized protein n=1 Tax=Prorocentrum cordatum TaxID=2364126 RepID=A0ABN9QBF7_9DINO|nr:unnamed protein product [Polarella glacialis]